MVQPPPATPRRAFIAAAWLLLTLAGLITAVWFVGWALSGGDEPSLDTVEEATHLHYPDGTDVVDADLSEMHVPRPGARADVTVDIPADAFGDFIADNDMTAPLLSGTAPAGQATGVLPPGCTDDVCYAGSILVSGDTVTAQLRVTLL